MVMPADYQQLQPTIAKKIKSHLCHPFKNVVTHSFIRCYLMIILNLLYASQLKAEETNVLFICLTSARQQSVFAYPKQRATVLVGSVLKWRARPQCLYCQKSVFAYPRQRATVSVGSVLKWRARPQCFRRRRDFVLQMNNTKEVSPKIAAQMRTIYVTAQSVQIAGAAESADSP
jgi:hypothetical protein